MKILLSIIIGIVFGLSFCYPNYVSAHLIPGFSIQPDQNYTDPVTHYLYTKEGHPHITISRDSEFTLPMTLKSENDSLMTSYLFLVTNGTDFSSEIILPEISIRVVPDHFIIHDGIDQKFNIVIKTSKNAPSGVYEPNLVTVWDNNVTKSRIPMPIPFQVGKWHWDSLSRQMESGISAKNVVCKSNHQIVIIKLEDGSPACVKPDTAQKLVERGWAMAVTTYKQQNVPTLSNSITVPNTNFTINYDFAGKGKILGADMNTQSKSLILSLETASNGTLTVSVPRALLDIKKNDRGMGEFHMLADGQETPFKEIHTTQTDRIFSIPFHNGTSKIMIIATELI